MNITKKKSVKKRASKAIVTQDNRFIYAKYDMNANEMKFFMWIVAQLNSQREQLFQFCEIPLSEIFEIFENQPNSHNYTYIRNLCDSMLKKTYIEDFKLLDETTMKEVSVYQGYTLFKSIRYQEGQGFITYQLNDSLAEYLLDLKRDFTQLKFSDIQQMKSAYSIRIYNMLICELKQNRQSLKMSLAVLQNILEVPKSLLDWQGFQRRVLDQAKKDINGKSNLVLLDIKTFKTGRKITELEFVFDYKNNNKRIERDNDKKKSYNLALTKHLSEFVGKRMVFEKYPEFGKLVFDGWLWENDEQKRVVALMRIEKSDKPIKFLVKDFKSIQELKKAINKADELFYTSDENIEKLRQIKADLSTGDLFKGLYKKI